MEKNISESRIKRLQELSEILKEDNKKENSEIDLQIQEMIDIISKSNLTKEPIDKLSKLSKAYQGAKKAGMNMWNAFKNEGKDNSEMLKVFNSILREKLNMNNRNEVPTKEEIESAIKQLKNIPKLAVLTGICGGVSFVLPGSTQAYLASAVGIYNSTGGKINLIPKHFEELLKNKETGKLSLKQLIK